MVGAEARALSLIVAIFLFGLASGYYVFGRFSYRDISRKSLLKVYGYIELAISSYALLFPSLFPLLKSLAFNGPSFFVFDVFITFITLFFPTFLMGSSIPILTMVLPNDHKEVNYCHSRIYGFNTLGAFIGVLMAGFLLVPSLGLPYTLYITGLINLLMSFVFIVNKLDGRVYKSTDIPYVKNSIPNLYYFLLVLIVGAITISLEIGLIRVLNLSIGSSIYNFPIILSIFILALATGALSISNKDICSKKLSYRLLLSIIFLFILNFSAPYWSIWISHIRISLNTIESNYYIYLFLVYFFLFIFIFPSIFFLGQLLPLVYGLIKKTKKDYGLICGKLYFYNTLGTTLGAIFLSYLALYIFNLDDIFKINLVLLIVLSLVLNFYEKSIKVSIISILFLISSLLLSWNRNGHYIGYFRDILPSNYHFKGLFNIPKIKDYNITYFNDGPNTTVSLNLFNFENKLKKEIRRLKDLGFPHLNYSIVVNGKSDSSILYDFPTNFLLSIIPYFFSPQKSKNLSTAVIGMGTGISSGILGKLHNVEEVISLEISTKVLEAVKYLDDINFNVYSNEKVKIIEKDAFSYFAKNTKKFNIIVSEPSNPWVVGVENIFTIDFYQLVKDSLKEDGIFSQWIPMYDMSDLTFRLISESLMKVFPYVSVFNIMYSDIIVLASSKPLSTDVLKKGFVDNKFLRPYLKEMGILSSNDIYFTKPISDKALNFIGKLNLLGMHSLEFPKLSYRAFNDFFMNKSTTTYFGIPEILRRNLSNDKIIVNSFKQYIKLGIKEIKNRCSKLMPYFCNRVVDFIKFSNNMNNDKENLIRRLQSYGVLRDRGLIEKDINFLNDIRKNILAKLPSMDIDRRKELLFLFIKELLFEKNFIKANRELLGFKHYFDDKDIYRIKKFMEKQEIIMKNYLRSQ